MRTYTAPLCEPPLQRFEHDEARALRSLPAKAPFLQVRELTRRVQRRLHRVRYQPLQRSIAADRRDGHRRQ